MKSLTSSLIVSACLATAQGASVAIANFNMESAPTAQTDGNISSSVATGWTHTTISGTTGTFTFNTTTSTRYYNEADFLDTNPSTAGARGTMAGPNFTGISGTGSGRIQQTVGTTLAANTQYTLAVALGHRTVDAGAAAPASQVTLELLAGAVSLGTATYDPSGGIWSDAGALPDDIWADGSLVITTGANPAQLGQALTVRFIKSGVAGIYMDIDNVRLDATAVPEPSLALLSALGSLGLLRRRRR